MTQNFPTQNIGKILIIWSLFYFADYYFTLYNSINYPLILDKHFVHKGNYEIDTRLQNDNDNCRLFSFTFFKSWIITCLGFLLFWWLSIIGNLPQLLDVYNGLLFLLFDVTHLRHFFNFASYISYKYGDLREGI